MPLTCGYDRRGTAGSRISVDFAWMTSERWNETTATHLKTGLGGSRRQHLGLGRGLGLAALSTGGLGGHCAEMV